MAVSSSHDTLADEKLLHRVLGLNSLLCVPCFLHPWECEHDGEAASGGFLQTDRAAAGGDESVDDRQPDSSAP